MIKGIIFDVDGTLLDSMQIWDELGTRYLKGKNIKAGTDLNKILFSMSFEEGCLYLKDQYNLPYSTEEIAEDIVEIMKNFYLYEVETKNGVKEFIEVMRKQNIPMIIATSSDKEIVKLAFDNLGITDFFVDIVTCTELNTNKRKPDIYLHCAQIIDTEPRETAVFEDVLHGIKSAKAAGFITVAVEDFSSVDERFEIKALADYYIKDFTKIDILKI